MGAEQSQLLDQNVKQNSVGFFINGKEYNVNVDKDGVGPQTLLVDFIRDKAGLKGTKYMCREGGCGACVVTVKGKDPNTGSEMVRAVNSCLVPVLSAEGWDITTVEGLGNKKTGYHKIQQQLVKFSGTQCGFCTPGMVMNMYSLSQANPNFKMKDVEDSFDGNLCRCTGYRPILEAFKSIAGDASEELKRKCGDIEDCIKCPVQSGCCRSTQRSCSEDCSSVGSDEFDRCSETSCSAVYLKLKSGEEWVKATSLDMAFDALQRFVQAGMKYRVVGGNTGTGVFKYDGPYQAFIDVNDIPELKKMVISSSSVEIGSGTTLSSFIDLPKKVFETEGFAYMMQITKHVKRVANVPVRNAGTIAGNLMMKHAHRDFPSDIFLLLEASGARLKIGSSPTLSKEYTMLEFRDLDMTGKLILSILFPPYVGDNYFIRSYKITRRFQNAHAYVNGAVLIRVDPKKSNLVMEKPRIVFGGINPDFVHASETEKFLTGKYLNSATIQNAMSVLEKELNPDEKPPDASPEYRKTLAQALLYKTILAIVGDTAKAANRSGGQDLEHGMTSSKQSYDTQKDEWPLYKPIPKLEAVVQASGEAEYVNDINPEFGELFGAFVVTNVGPATLKNVDPSDALMVPGVHSFISAKDIPGLNNYAIFYPEPEQIFAKDKITFAGQSVGLIIAETREAAFAAVKKVNIMYDDMKTPVLDIKDAIKLAHERDEMSSCLFEICKSEDVAKLSESELKATNTIKGEFRTGAQFHMSMETQSCICVPREDGMDVYAATQYPDNVQATVSAAIGIPNNDVNVVVRRLGGAYGAKISKATHIASACAVAAHVANRPVRVVMDLETNMKMIGKRLPYYTKYEATVNDDGTIVGLKASIFCDPGSTPNEATVLLAMVCMQNCYRATGWEIKPGKALTNHHPNTYCRAPGSTQGIATIEAIIEHIAHELGKDPLEIRMKNLIQTGDSLIGAPGAKFEGENLIPMIFDELKTSADYDARKKFIETFNQANRFRKRGMALMGMRYPQHYPDFNLRFPVFISVYHVDGSVAVSHGGIEMGQGLNTKCAQTVAKFLGIPLEKVRIKPTTTVISPNGGVTGGAMGSELICHAAMKACEILLEKMAPVKKAMKDPTWEKVVTACYNQNLLLTAQYQDKPGLLKAYDVWGACITEVDVDVLTGEYKVVRADIIEDAGFSLSPEVDIGQIEGSYVMGLGMWATEKLVWDKSTGELLTTNTWEYKPPFAKDIPEDFRVTMLKNRPNPYGVLRSKATGEPPFCLSVSVLFAIKNAIDSARRDAGNKDWYQIDGPITPEDIQRLSLTSASQFDL